MAEGKKFEKTRQLSDLFGIGVDKQYQTVSSVIKVPAGAGEAVTVAKHDLFGQPVKKVSGDWTFVLAGDEAAAEGLFYQGDPVDELAVGAATPRPCTIIVRGQGILKKRGWPANDIEGNALTPTNLEAPMLALRPPLVVVDDTGAETTEATL